MTIGVLMLIVGTAAILFPAATSVSVTLLLGVVLAIGGVSRLIGMFRSAGWGDFLLQMLAAVIYLAAAVMLLVYPFGATITLTLVLGLFFVAQGIAGILVSIVSRQVRGRGWMLLSGLVSFILGAMIWTDLPSSATWAIGLLVGVYLIFDGWAMIMTSWAMHNEDRTSMG
jgi:uncharacterized membrane protein HdeD (DUF308 family)